MSSGRSSLGELSAPAGVAFVPGAALLNPAAGKGRGRWSEGGVGWGSEGSLEVLPYPRSKDLPIVGRLFLLFLLQMHLKLLDFTRLTKLNPFS